jgi:hypothetical protein
MKKLVLTLAVALAASPALADRGAADACAAGLSADSKAIYQAAIGQVQPGADNRAIVKGIVENMVASGQLGMLGAKSAAQAAGACLKKLGS